MEDWERISFHVQLGESLNSPRSYFEYGSFDSVLHYRQSEEQPSSRNLVVVVFQILQFRVIKSTYLPFRRILSLNNSGIL